jgi:oligo-1,6-glucosidase
LKRPWWKEAVVYQIYPRSFYDSNKDGIGDLGGILAKLDYLQDLGVDVLWLSPIYQSPNEDNGYDISDYREILSDFGTLEEFDVLLAEAHRRGLKIVMDLVVNHTSDEHPWFIEARKSTSNAYRDYYIWRDEPTAWTSIFSGPAWDFDAETGQYYLHIFSKKQPDLNWENAEVRNEIYDLMQFWLDKGIDGFRMDVINMISKHFDESDHSRDYFLNGPRIHTYLQEMNKLVLSHYDIMSVGETPGVTPDEAALYTGTERNELNMVFQFQHMGLDSAADDKWDVVPWKLSELKRVMSRWQEGLYGVGWNSLYLNNHDQPRMVSRFGNDTTYRIESAKMLATFLHMMQGTPYVYQGEEIGMTNVAFPSITHYADVETLNMWRERVIDGGADPDLMLKAIHQKGRDNARTPMQWNSTRFAGFTEGEKPWLEVNPNYREINAEQATADPQSIFHYYKKLIRLRKTHDVIVDGRYALLLPDHPEIYAYTRTLESEVLLVVLNFYGGTPAFTLPQDVTYGQSELLISNYAVTPGHKPDEFTLKPYEACVYLLSN